MSRVEAVENFVNSQQEEPISRLNNRFGEEQPTHLEMEQQFARGCEIKQGETEVLKESEEESQSEVVNNTPLIEDELEGGSPVEPHAEEQSEGHTVQRENVPVLDDSMLQRIDTKLSQLQFTVESQMMESKNQQQIIDNLHSELQSYRNKEKQDTILPFVKDLISLIDKLEKEKRHLQVQGDNQGSNVALNFAENTIQDLEDVLYRQGIEAENRISDVFDGQQHKLLGTQITNDKALSQKIYEVYGKAYKWDERLIRPALVKVYHYVDDSVGGK